MESLSKQAQRGCLKPRQVIGINLCCHRLTGPCQFSPSYQSIVKNSKRTQCSNTSSKASSMRRVAVTTVWRKRPSRNSKVLAARLFRISSNTINSLMGLADFDAIIVRSATKLTKEMLEASQPRLKVVARAGVGVDNIDLDAASRLGLRSSTHLVRAPERCELRWPFAVFASIHPTCRSIVT